MSNFIIILFSLLYSGILNVIFFSKTHINSLENKIFSIMLVANFCGLFNELMCFIVGATLGKDNFLMLFITKLYLIYLIFFLFLISLYIGITCFISTNQDILYQTYKRIMLVVFIISVIISIILPVNIETSYATGTAVNFIYLSSTLHIIVAIFLVLSYWKKIEIKKFIPFFSFVILVFLVSIFQKAYPQYTLITSVEFLVIFVMYFTIENPDLKIIEELSKAQKLSEATNNEKTNFLYIVTDDVLDKLNKVENVYNAVLDLKPSLEIENYMNDLKAITNNARTKIKKTIDISDMDSKLLTMTNNKYDIMLLLKSIYYSKKKDVSDKVDFRLNICNDLPKELYGDSIKLKQILTTVLDNSIEYTKEGFIELRVNYIIKNDICRLIITIEDTGKGIDIFKQNEIMSNHDDLTKEEVNHLDDMNLNLKVVRKMISIIGGTFLIDGNKYYGTTINITIDQKMGELYQTKEEKQIESYSESLKNQKRCAIITENKSSIKVIKSVLKKQNYKVEEFNRAKDVLDILRNNEVFDLIFIDEYMDKIDARTFISKVKVIENFKGKVIVISKVKDIKNKKELLDLGFKGIILEPVNKKEVQGKFENL